MARHTKAKEFYVLDGYVTDYVALCKNVSHLYRWLLVFEDDEKRKTAMMARRVNELLPILDQLGTNAYNDTLKQLAFEVFKKRWWQNKIGRLICGDIFLC